MIIDFHTHIFPDKVAEKAVPKLAAVINHNPSMNGTAAGLLDSCLLYTSDAADEL